MDTSFHQDFQALPKYPLHPCFIARFLHLDFVLELAPNFASSRLSDWVDQRSWVARTLGSMKQELAIEITALRN